MPVEIREIQITAAVQDSGGGKASGSAPASPQGNSEELIAKCVEQVLEILKEQKER